MTLSGLVLVACVILLGAYLHGDNSPTRIDAEATRRLVRVSPTHGVEPRDTYHDIAAIGSAGPVLIVIGIFAVWATSRRDATAVVTALAGPAMSVLTAEHVMKPLVDRRVVDGGALSYPSGTTTAVAAVAVVGVWLVGRFRGRRLALLALLPAVVIDSLVTVAVVGLSWHHLTDAVAGVMYGTGSVLVVAGAVTPWRTSAELT